MTARARCRLRGAALVALAGLAACAPADGPEPMEVETAEGMGEAAAPVEREWPPEELRPGGRVAAELGEQESHRLLGRRD